MKMNTKVKFNNDNSIILGLVVGKASSGLSETYIIKCIDNQLPNDTYKYDTFVAQLIDLKEVID